MTTTYNSELFLIRKLNNVILWHKCEGAYIYYFWTTSSDLLKLSHFSINFHSYRKHYFPNQKPGNNETIIWIFKIQHTHSLYSMASWEKKKQKKPNYQHNAHFKRLFLNRQQFSGKKEHVYGFGKHKTPPIILIAVTC